MTFIKNLDHERALKLTDEAAVAKGQVVSKTLAQNDAISITSVCLLQGRRDQHAFLTWRCHGAGAGRYSRN